VTETAMINFCDRDSRQEPKISPLSVSRILQAMYSLHCQIWWKIWGKL